MVKGHLCVALLLASACLAAALDDDLSRKPAMGFNT
jgi:hypothetical protein